MRQAIFENLVGACKRWNVGTDVKSFFQAHEGIDAFIKTIPDSLVLFNPQKAGFLRRASLQLEDHDTGNGGQEQEVNNSRTTLARDFEFPRQNISVPMYGVFQDDSLQYILDQ